MTNNQDLTVVVNITRAGLYAEMYEWFKHNDMNSYIEQNAGTWGDYSSWQVIYSFTNDLDAVHFKLRWSEYL